MMGRLMTTQYCDRKLIFSVLSNNPSIYRKYIFEVVFDLPHLHFFCENTDWVDHFSADYITRIRFDANAGAALSAKQQ